MTRLQPGVCRMPNNGSVSTDLFLDAADTSDLRKARGATLTPEPLTRFITNSIVRSIRDRVMKPSARNDAFLIKAVRRLIDPGTTLPTFTGVEVHEHSAQVARDCIAEARGMALDRTGDHSVAELVELFGAGRAIVNRALDRHPAGVDA